MWDENHEIYRKFRHQVINAAMLHQDVLCAAIETQMEIVIRGRVEHFQKDSKESVPSFLFSDCMLL